MSEAIRNMSKELYGINHYLPDFAINNEIVNRGIRAGDYTPRINNDLGDVYWKFKFDKNVGWDEKKTNDLLLSVDTYHRFELIFPKSESKFEELMLQQRPVTKDMLYNHYFIFDKKGYERIGFDGIFRDFVLKKDYEPFSYFDHIGEESVETRDDALSMIPDRVSAMIGQDYIVAHPLFLKEGSVLFEEIGSKFFEAKTE